MARPPKAQEAINGDELLELMKFYPSRQDAADWFKVSMSSIERFVKNNFKCSFEELRGKGFIKTKTALKRKQIEMALSGDRVMLIWLGKQFLDQSEKAEQKTQLSGPNGAPLIPELKISDEQLKRMAVEFAREDADG